MSWSAWVSVSFLKLDLGAKLYVEIVFEWTEMTRVRRKNRMASLI